MLPTSRTSAWLALQALSLAFVGLVQGAGVAAGVPNGDGKPADDSRNFIGQGVGNIVSGVLRACRSAARCRRRPSSSRQVRAPTSRCSSPPAVMSLVILIASGVV